MAYQSEGVHRMIFVSQIVTVLALYLLSDLSTFVTGQTILVNGGAVLH